MAEVYGNIGDQQVELNNAATEATLTALLAVSKAQYEKQVGGKNTKAYRDLEKNLKSLVKQSQNFNKAVSNSTVEIDKQTQSIRAARQAYEEQAGSMKKFAVGALKVTAAVLNAAAGVNQMASQISRMGNSLSSATTVLRSIPVVGDGLSSALGAIAGAVETTQRSFIDAASVGANFAGSMESMIDHATNAGLTIDQFSQIIRSNGADLAFLSSSTAEGAKRLSLLASTMRKSGIQDQLAYLGFSLEDINTGMASFSGMLAKGGINIRGMANERLVELTSNYMTNLDAVSKLTGQNRKDLEKQRQERQRDSRNRILERRLDVDSRNRLNSTFDVVGPEISKGLQDLFMGYIQSPEAQDLATFQGESAQLAVQLGESMRSSGKLSSESVDMLVQSLANGAKKISSSELVNVLGGPLAERYGNFVVANMDLERLRGKSLAEVEKEIQNELAARKASGKEADPAAIMRTQQDLAKASNQATEFLVKQTGILTSALDLMSGALTHTIGYLNKLIDVGREGGFTAVLSEIGNDVFDAMKRAISYLFDSLTAIGERLGKALWNSLPSSLKNWFGSEEEKEMAKLTKIKQDLEKKIAETQGLIANPPSGRRAQGIDQTKILADLQRQLDENNAKIQVRVQAQTGPQTLPPVPQAQQRANAAQIQATNNNTVVTEQQAELTRLEAERAKLREEQQRRSQELQAQNIEAQQDNTKATTANTSTVKAAASCDLDYSSPQALFNSFAKIMVGGKPGATDKLSGASVATSTGEDEMFSGVGSSNMQNYLKTVAMIESSGNPMAKAGTSSASGLFQFTKGTWEETVKAMGKDYSQEDRFDPKKATEVMEFFTQKQKAQLEKSTGKSASGVDMYMAHFLGAGGAGKFINAMSASPNASAADVVGPQAASANKSIFYKNDQARSLQEVYNLMASKYQKHESNVLTGNIPAVVASVSKHMAPSGSQAVTAITPEKDTTPSGPQVVTAITPEKETSSVVNTAAQTGAGGTTTSQPGLGAPGASAVTTISSLAEQLETLNSSVGQLVAYTEASLKLTEKHITATRSLSNDQFT